MPSEVGEGGEEVQVVKGEREVGKPNQQEEGGEGEEGANIKAQQATAARAEGEDGHGEGDNDAEELDEGQGAKAREGEEVGGQRVGLDGAAAGEGHIGGQEVKNQGAGEGQEGQGEAAGEDQAERAQHPYRLAKEEKEDRWHV